MGVFKDKIIKELLSNKQYELADVIDSIESDLDAANYLSANRAYFTKAYSSKDLEQMPLFRKALYDDLNTGIVDYDKEFGKDWYKDYKNIPADQIKFVADKQGKDFKSLTKEMQDEVIRRNRYDIAHEGVLGTVMPFVTPRIQEAVERGESPSAADVVIDVGETAVQAVPWGRASMLAVNNPVVRRLVGGGISNLTAPLLTEAADAAAYDSTNARGDFSPVDVAAGFGVNALGANLLKGVGGRGATALGMQDAGRKLMNLGEGTSQRQVKKELTKDMAAGYKRSAKDEIIKQYPNIASIEDKATSATFNSAEQNTRNNILNKIDLAVNSNVPGYVPKFTEDELKLMVNDPVLSKYISFDRNFRAYPTEGSLMKQEAVKNLITNKLGGWMDEQGKALTRIPVAGPMIQQRLDELEKEEEEKAVRDSLMNYILTKYGNPRGL